MAYSKGATITLKSSASLLPNNLSVLTGAEGDSTTFAVVHKNSANIVHIASGVSHVEEVFFDKSDSKDPDAWITDVGHPIISRSSTHSNNLPLQCNWCQLPSRTVLVLTSFKGIQVFPTP